MFDETAIPVLTEGQCQFLLGVHDDGTLPGNRLSQGLFRDQEKAKALFTRTLIHPLATRFLETLKTFRPPPPLQSISLAALQDPLAGGITFTGDVFMRHHRILFMLAFLAAAFVVLIVCCTEGEAMGLSDKYVGNKMVDLEWTRYTGDDFDRYELWRDGEEIETFGDQDTTFHRDEEDLYVDEDHSYVIKVINETGVEKDSRGLNVHTGNVEGEITLPTTWDDVKYNLTGNVIIAKEATFTIDENVDVYTYRHGFDVQGLMSDLSKVSFFGYGLTLDGSKAQMTRMTIDGCEFDGTEASFNPGYGLNLGNLNVTITGTTIRDYDAGIWVTGGEATIENNTIENMEDFAGIRIDGNGYMISENKIYDSARGLYVQGNDGFISDNEVSGDEDGALYFKGDNATISGNELRNGGEYGIKCECDNLTITNNEITGNDYNGIWALQLTNSTIKENRILKNDAWGIYIQGGQHNEISGNIINGNYLGLHATGNPNSSYHHNNLSDNKNGGLDIVNSGGADIHNNNVHNCSTGIRVDGGTDVSLTFNEVDFSTNWKFAIAVHDTDNVTIRWNKVSFSHGGIKLGVARKAVIQDNTLEYINYTGIDLLSVWDTLVDSHIISNLEDKALSIQAGHRVTVENMEISNCKIGYHVSEGGNVTFSGNKVNHCENGVQASQTMDNVTVKDCELSFNRVGVYTHFNAKGFLLEDNEFRENGKGVYLYTASEDNTIQNNEIYESEDFGIHCYQTKKNLITKNKIENTENDTGFDEGCAVFLEHSNNVTVEDNDINNCSRHGIYVYSWEEWDQNYILSNRVTNTSSHGIMIDRSNNNQVKKNDVTKVEGDGAIFIRWADDCVIEENEVYENERHGLYFQGSGLGGKGNTAGNNTLKENDGAGIMFEDMYECFIGFNKLDNNSGFGIFFRAMNEDRNHDNTFRKNEIWEKQNADPTAFYFDVRDPNSTSTVFEENSVGIKKPATITLKEIQPGYYSVRGVEEPPEDPRPPEYGFKATNISNYVEISSTSEDASLVLIFHYSEADLDKDGTTIPEESLRVWRYGPVEKARGGGRGSGDPFWRLGDEEGEVSWNGSRILDDATQTVGVEIKKFSIFAPLSSLPVHNLDTGKDYARIDEALLDGDTQNGHTIAVDPSYTGTLEDFTIEKKITLISSSGDPADTIINTQWANKPVIQVKSEEVTVRGLTIKGATENIGILAENKGKFTMENCVLTGNKYGAHLKGDEDYNVTGCTFTGNLEGGLYLEDVEDAELSSNRFEDKMGLHLLRASKVEADGNHFENNADTGLYSFEGEENEVTNSRITNCGIGIYLESTTTTTIKTTTMELCETGIRLRESEENELEGGFLEEFETGILLQVSHHNIIKDFDLRSSQNAVLEGVIIFNSRHNELEQVMVRDMTSSTGNVTGMRFSGASDDNTIRDVTIEDFLSAGVTGIYLNASWNTFHDIDIQELTGTDRATGIHVEDCHNDSFTRLTMSEVEAREKVVGVRALSSENLSFQDINVTMITSEDETGCAMLFDMVGPACEVRDSWFSENDIGIVTANGSQPEVHWNTIIGNTVAGMENMDGAVVVNAENNWWGDRSGPGGSGPGTGESVSDFIDYEPWIGATYTGVRVEEVAAGEGSVDAKGETDTELDYDASGELAITTFRYDENPGGGFQGDLGKYIDVHIDRAANANELEIKLYYTAAELGGKEEAKLRMMWWDGGEWQECSDSGVNTADLDGYAGYIWARVGTDTTPALGYLGGTPFGAMESEDVVVHEIDITIGDITEKIEPDAQITVSGSITVTPESDIEDVTVFLDGVEEASANLAGSDFSADVTLPGDLAEGEHEIKVQVKLDTGEMNETTITIQYTKEEPVTHTITISNFVVTGAFEPGEEIMVSCTIDVEPPAAVESVKILLDGAGVAIAVLNDQQYEATVAVPDTLTEGDHTITVNASLGSGEFAEKETTITYEQGTTGEEDDDDDDGGGGIMILLVLVIVVVIVILLWNTGMLPTGPQTERSEGPEPIFRERKEEPAREEPGEPEPGEEKAGEGSEKTGPVEEKETGAGSKDTKPVEEETGETNETS